MGPRGGLEGIQPHVLVLGPREEEVAALEDLSLSFLKVINGSRGQLGLFLQFVIYQGHLDIWEHLGLFGHLRLLHKCPPVFPNVRFPSKIKIAETAQSPYMVKSLFLSWMFLILLLENCVLFQYTDHYINNTMIKLL